MSRVEQLEKQVRALSPEELADFREWFVQFDWDAWDREIQRDVEAGALDSAINKTLQDHAAGKTTPL